MIELIEMSEKHGTLITINCVDGCSATGQERGGGGRVQREREAALAGEIGG